MTDIDNADALQALAQEMSDAYMRGQWQNETNRAVSGWVSDTLLPVARGRPYVWRAEAIDDFLRKASTALPESMTARRSVLFNNPGLERGTVATINMGIQMILPGEIAWAHRHTISALRFVIDGHEGLVTAVNGVACPMQSGDLILTPGGTWHDHYNGGDKPLRWLDVLDGPVINAINQTVFQNYGEKRQPLRNSPDDTHSPVHNHQTPLRFPWADVQAALEARRSKVPDDSKGYVYEYLDPKTGEYPMRTLGCRVRLLPKGYRGDPYRDRANSVVHVFRGSGTLIADGEVIDWQQGDCFALPGWCERTLQASAETEAYLFEVHDVPLLENLGLLQDDLPQVIEERLDTNES